MENVDYVIKFTNDLNQFKLLDNNRNIDQSRVHKIYQSMKKDGLLVIPIVVNKNFEVIDGQHRLQASKLSGTGIYYHKVDNYTEKEVVKINTNSKSWNRKDFLDFYISKGNTNYILLKQYNDIFDKFSITDCMILLRNGNTSSIKKDVFNSGNFTIINYDKGVEWGEFILSLKKYFPDGYYRTVFVRSIAHVLYNYEEIFDKDEFIKKCELVPHYFKICPNQKDYVRVIEDIYNFKRRLNSKIAIRV